MSVSDSKVLFTRSDGQQGSPWVYAIAVVTFHVEHGQVVEVIQPENLVDEATRKKICCLALPDSNSGQNGDLQFAFRVRQDNLPLDSVNYSEHEFLFASVFFRQIKDSSLARGYFQKSVVLLSKQPFTNFLHECARIIGPLYFEFGEEVLSAIWENIYAWEAPIPGKACQLELAGETVFYHVPWEPVEPGALLQPDSEDAEDKERSEVRSASSSLDISAGQEAMNNLLEHNQKQKVPGLFQDIRLFTTFGGLSVALWHIWELAMVGDPILVLAPAPDSCSQVVMAVASLTAPIRYHSDYRPYFTVYDPDFDAIRKRHNNHRGKKMPSSCVLGVTNPYFLKALEYWPNVISMGTSTATPARPAPLKSRQHSAEQVRERALRSRSKTVPSQVPRGMGQPHPVESLAPAVGRGFPHPQSLISLVEPVEAQSTEEKSGAHVEEQEDDVSESGSGEGQGDDVSDSGGDGVHERRAKVIRRHEYVAPSDIQQTHSVQGESIRNAQYKPTIVRRDESLNSLLVDQQYEHSMILTREEPLVPPDPNVLNKLVIHKADSQSQQQAQSAQEAGLPWEPPAVSINNKILREHFRKLTMQFLEPLEKYFRLTSVGSRAAQMRQGIQLSAYSEMNVLQDMFNLDHFMLLLESDVPPMLQRVKWKSLYMRFIQGPNFAPWYNLQQERLRSQLGHIYRHLRLNTDTEILLMSKSQAGQRETSSVHLYLNVKKALEIELAKPDGARDRELCHKMNEHLAAVKALLHNSEGRIRLVEGK